MGNARKAPQASPAFGWPPLVPDFFRDFWPGRAPARRYVLWTYEFGLALRREKPYVINAVKASERSAVRLAH